MRTDRSCFLLEILDKPFSLKFVIMLQNNVFFTFIKLVLQFFCLQTKNKSLLVFQYVFVSRSPVFAYDET